MIDLDTVMPGLGALRFRRHGADHDQPGVGRRTRPLEGANADADVRGARARLSFHGRRVPQRAEKAHLAFAGKLITFEQGIRFLADYLAGDVYYKIHREGHNLDRCRTQFKLVESIERQEAAMNKLAEKC